MGVDYYAYAVIGCEVTDKLCDTVLERRCACPPPPIQAAYCPTCGSSTGPIERQIFKPWYNADDQTIGSLTVSFTTNDKRAIAGLRSKVSSSSERLGFADVWPISSAEFIETVKAELEKFGLWDPATFGLWAVLHCSY